MCMEQKSWSQWADGLEYAEVANRATYFLAR